MLTIVAIFATIGVAVLFVGVIISKLESDNYARLNSENSPNVILFEGKRVKTQNGWRWQ